MLEKLLEKAKMMGMEDDIETMIVKKMEAYSDSKHHKFSFEGKDHTHMCRATPDCPHYPHAMSLYTIPGRQGILEHFCLGKEGDGITIVVSSRSGGSREDPVAASGYCFVPRRRRLR